MLKVKLIKKFSGWFLKFSFFKTISGFCLEPEKYTIIQPYLEPENTLYNYILNLRTLYTRIP